MFSNFYGRDKEIALLRAEFDACAARAEGGAFVGPRMAFIIAESGIGKSRLVQELYLQLATDPRLDPPEADYWPDACFIEGDEAVESRHGTLRGPGGCTDSGFERGGAVATVASRLSVQREMGKHV